MYVKKSRGAAFTKAEQKAIDAEIGRQLAEASRQYQREVTALVLWELHEQLGLGAYRLKKFYDRFDSAFDELIQRYELGEEDYYWICTEKLKKLGVNLDSWEK